MVSKKLPLAVTVREEGGSGVTDMREALRSMPLGLATREKVSDDVAVLASPCL